MERMKLFKLGVCSVLVASVAQAFAVPLKTWDAIFNAEGQGEYSAAKIEGDIRFGEYTHYKNVQPVSFRVLDGKFDFSVAGNMTVPAKVIEDSSFYENCRNTMEAWISYFDKPRRFGNEEQIIYIAGVDFACGNDLYNVQDLRIKFTNPMAQKAWVADYEGRQKFKREQLSQFRKAEQEHRAEIRDKSTSFTDPRDGQVYRIIKVEGREWFAQNVNYEVPGHSWCYEDKDSYCARSGRLYDLEGARKACPEGWHLPTRKEWETMIRFAKKDSRCKDVLSVIASEEWVESSSDKYGFSMFPGGRGDCNEEFELIDFSAHFWCAEGERRYGCLFFEEGNDEIDDEDYPAYASVRLIKDA